MYSSETVAAMEGAHEEMTHENGSTRNPNFRYIIAMPVLVMLLGGAFIIVGSMKAVNVARGTSESPWPTYAPTSLDYAKFADFLFDEVEESFLVPQSPQWLARRWMVEEDPLQLFSKNRNIDNGRILQRYSLAVVFFSMSQTQASNVDWMSIDECDSVHLDCDEFGMIRAMEIGKLCNSLY